MLVAEIRGKRSELIAENEDMLTSAVFGHLRFVPPDLFWPDLFSRAQTCRSPQTDLTQVLANKGFTLSDCNKLDCWFWPDCGAFGEPDLVLRFSSEVSSVIVLIEVKLNSSKSGTGENDQLARYLRLLDQPDVRDDWKNATDRVVVYLTKTVGRTEVLDSIEAASDLRRADERIFTLQWQDILEVAQNSHHSENSTVFADKLLEEVAIFLRYRHFERFRGFRKMTLGTNFLGLSTTQEFSVCVTSHVT